MNFEVEKKISVRDHELLKSILDELCVYRDHSIKNDISFAHETVKDPDFKKDKIFRIRECVDNTFVILRPDCGWCFAPLVYWRLFSQRRQFNI